MKTINGWKFQIVKDEIGTTLTVVTEEDYNAGFNTSYEVSDEIIDLVDELNCPELMEGVYEVFDQDEVRKSLIEAGLTEIK